jgi:hypothetical protein
MSELFAFDRGAGEKKWGYNETVHQLLIDFKKIYDSVRRKVVCNSLIDFSAHMKSFQFINV